MQRILGMVTVLVVVGLAATIGSLDYQETIIFWACFGTIIAIFGDVYAIICCYNSIPKSK